MHFPFVSRGIYNDVVGDLRARLRHQEEQTRYLTDLVADMKVSGASVVRHLTATGALEPKKLERRTPSAIEQAIDENKHASSNPRLRAHLSRWAEKRLAQLHADNPELDDEELITLVQTELRTWSIVSTEDEDEDDDDGILALNGPADVNAPATEGARE